MCEVLHVFFCLEQWLPAIKIPARIDVIRGNESIFQTINDGLLRTRELFGVGLPGAALVISWYVYVYVYGQHFQRSMDHRSVRLSNQSCSCSAVTGKMFFSLSRSRLKIWFPETGSAVPSRVSLLILNTQAES